MAQINAIEIVVNEFLQSLGAWLKGPMLAVTTLGNEQFYILLLPTIYWCFDQMVGLRVGIIFLVGNTVNSFFKLLFHNARPYWISENIKQYYHETSFGIPSGHAQTPTTIWAWLACEIKRWFTIAALVLAFLIGVSRLYLGVHFLSDVLMGWLLAGLLVWAFSAWHEKAGHWLGKQSLGIKLVLVFSSAVLMIALVLLGRMAAGSWVMNPEWAERAGEVDPLNLEGVFTLSGTWVGMLGGFVLLTEMKGYFLAGKGGWRRLARFLAGLLGVMALYLGLGKVFPDTGDAISFTLRFVRYMLIGLWVSWLGPVVFEKMKLLQFEDKEG
jgi:membrane-associated phospholipid phosphatase